MRECLDERILQSYFDGELSSEQMEISTSHLASCSNCAAAARELEGEINLLSNAIAPEFDANVPTERLRQRIEAAVAGLQFASRAQSGVSTSSVLRWFQSLAPLFAFTPRRAFRYAGLVVVLAFAAIMGIIQWRQTLSPTHDDTNNVASSERSGGPATKTGNTGSATVAAFAPQPIENAGLKTGGRDSISPRSRPVRAKTPSTNQTVAQVKLLPGERSYLKTIAALDTTINSTSNRPMRPALQAEYERNLALVDRALAATRNAAKKNPNDPDAAEFMFTAYQSKVNLLNTVADARSFNRQQ